MKWMTRILGGTVALFGAVALAEDPQTSQQEADCAPQAAVAPQAAEEPAPTPVRHGDDNRITRVGVDLETGGGVGGFLNSTMAAATGEQGQWTVRGVVGTRRHFPGEIAYVGSTQSVQGLTVDPTSHIIGGGLETNARFNLLTGALQPYAVAGVGWNHYSVTGTTLATSAAETNADIMTFPVGAGLAYRVRGLVLDARLGFHPAFGGNLIPDQNMSTWDLNGKIGFEF